LSLRELPSVDRLLQGSDGIELLQHFGRPLATQALREQLDLARAHIRAGGESPTAAEILSSTRMLAESWLHPSLVPVINATGVINHTNLGRSPLSRSARQAVESIAAGYSTLEYDLARGRRGKRDQHTESPLTRLTGAESALVVNNNAAAILLALTALAHRKEVLISRTQLIEIGGGFRIPDVLKQSGAKLVEVGTTNRTHLHDFETAITPKTALIMRAHHSNFKLVGFTTEPSLTELVALGNQHGLPVLDDLGSGALLDTANFGLGHEPTVQESLQAGAPLVAFSGDKLLGGPQAGILIGEGTLIERLRSHPLARAVRPDKLCLAALSATLLHYLRDEALLEIPIWRMIAAPAETMRERAEGWRKALGCGLLVEGRSTVGGGSLPEETLPTWLLALEGEHLAEMASRLRAQSPSIIARIEDDRLVLDPRTVLPEQEPELLQALKLAIAGEPGSSSTSQENPDEDRS
jgi:L-seryl-tRNA(Ser) seleniumtransferase